MACRLSSSMDIMFHEMVYMVSMWPTLRRLRLFPNALGVGRFVLPGLLLTHLVDVVV